MTIPVQGVDTAHLDEAGANALAILTDITPADLARLKNIMHLGLPAVVGPQTLSDFVALCQARGIDLSDAGVAAFKQRYGLTGGDAIGPTTAGVYAQTILAATPAPPAPGRHVTDRGLHAVENFEGLRLSAYLDQVGVPTIGFGHTAGVHLGQTITREQADAFLRSDLAVAEEAVCRLVTVPLFDNQFDALVSFTFNVGTGALARSSTLRLLNQGDYHGAADHMLAWCKGEVNSQLVDIPALVSRRAEERALFLGA